jgi:hypothetical protein
MKTSMIFPNLTKYTFVECKVLKLKLRSPKIELKWMPKQKRARGRTKKIWIKDIRKAMNERNQKEVQCKDRK